MIVLALYVTGGLVLFFFQDAFLFHPAPLPLHHVFSFEQPFEEINLPFKGNNLSIVKFRPDFKKKGIVLFFHGNMRNVEYYKKYPPLFTRNGYELWMIDYPGFGKSTGPRTEPAIYQQALAMYSLAVKEISKDSLLVYGKSIGTGIASFLASHKPCNHLILETPYYNIPALARHYFPVYPVVSMTRFTFPVNTYLSGIQIPVTIFHGTEDEVVPFSQSLQLAREHPNIDFISIDKGKHNNLFDFPVYQKKMDSLLRLKTRH